MAAAGRLPEITKGGFVDTKHEKAGAERRAALEKTDGLGRDVTEALAGSPPQTSRWRWAAWKQPVATGCTRPDADSQIRRKPT